MTNFLMYWDNTTFGGTGRSILTREQVSRMSGMSCYGAFGNDRKFQTFMKLCCPMDFYKIPGLGTLFAIGIDFSSET